jgi:hypothetical protein
LSVNGLPVQVARDLPRWSRDSFLFGTLHYVPGLPNTSQYVQQESTFWRRSLWDDAGGAMATAYRAEGDFELWVRFFRHAELYSVDALIGGYRRHPNSLSSSDISKYHRTCRTISENELTIVKSNTALRRINRLTASLRSIPGARSFWDRAVVRPFYHRLAAKAPPAIELRDDEWALSLR